MNLVSKRLHKNWREGPAFGTVHAAYALYGLLKSPSCFQCSSPEMRLKRRLSSDAQPFSSFKRIPSNMYFHIYFLSPTSGRLDQGSGCYTDSLVGKAKLADRQLLRVIQIYALACAYLLDSSRCTSKADRYSQTGPLLLFETRKIKHFRWLMALPNSPYSMEECQIFTFLGDPMFAWARFACQPAVTYCAKGRNMRKQLLQVDKKQDACTAVPAV